MYVSTEGWITLEHTCKFFWRYMEAEDVVQEELRMVEIHSLSIDLGGRDNFLIITCLISSQS